MESVDYINQLKDVTQEILDTEIESELKDLITERDEILINIGVSATLETVGKLFTPELAMDPYLSETGNVSVYDARELFSEVGDLWQELEKLNRAKLIEGAKKSQFTQMR